MGLFRLHAYTVEPQRTRQGAAAPVGGAVRITAPLKRVIEDNLRSAQFDRKTRVDFQVDHQTRTNETRDLILDFGFENANHAGAAATRLACRLSDAMDHRSAHCLLVLGAMRDGDQRRVTFWTFPKDQAFRFSSDAQGSTIQVLTDVFSQSSKLRKAALFEGRNLRNHFLNGRVLDFQANDISHSVANFWIRRFLQCDLSMAGDAGTRLLAKTVRKAVESCPELEAQEQFLAAVMAVRNAPQPRLSLQQFADRYLNDDAHTKFLAAVPNDEGRNSMFDFRRDVFDEALKFGVYALDTGVWVSSPLSEIGQSVRVDDDKRLACEGTIVKEKVRSRHA